MYRHSILFLLIFLTGCQSSNENCRLKGFDGQIGLGGLLSHADLKVKENYKVSLNLYAPQTAIRGPLLTARGQGTCKDGTISVTFNKAKSHNEALRFVSGAFTGASSTLPEYEHFGQWRIKVEELKSLAPYSFAKVEADGRKYISMRGSWITEKAQ